jgi:hypothetical protein
VQPATGVASKASGRRVAAPFGPISGWRVEHPPCDGPRIVVTTGGGSTGVTYVLGKAAACYRKTHALLEEQAELAHQVGYGTVRGCATGGTWPELC